MEPLTRQDLEAALFRMAEKLRTDVAEDLSSKIKRELAEELSHKLQQELTEDLTTKWRNEIAISESRIVNALNASVHGAIGEAEARLDAKYNRLETRFERMETAMLTQFEAYARSVSARFDRSTAIERSLEDRLAALENRVLRLETDTSDGPRP